MLNYMYIIVLIFISGCTHAEYDKDNWKNDPYF
jgi:hypothetical protein